MVVMYVISIDGACRRNGKPDCVSAGGVFIQQFVDGECLYTDLMYCSEFNSTNQRGEIKALSSALAWIDMQCSWGESVQIITDSEYIFNTMTKEWFIGWESRNWLTAAGEPVKNADLWKSIYELHKQCSNIDINYYHIKGHCISFGKVTANRLLDEDDSGSKLLQEIYKKYDASLATKQDTFENAQELSYRNNGFRLPDDIFRRFVVANTMADAIATKEVDAADSQS